MITLKPQWFRAEMARRNMTQDRFAREILGINPSYFSLLLSGRREPGPTIRQRIMDATGQPFDMLFEVIELREAVSG